MKTDISFKPINRHVMIQPYNDKKSEEKQKDLISFSDSKNKQRERYGIYTVVREYRNPDKQLRFGKRAKICVETSMVEEIKINNKSFFIVLENYIVGEISGLS